MNHARSYLYNITALTKLNPFKFATCSHSDFLTEEGARIARIAIKYLSIRFCSQVRCRICSIGAHLVPIPLYGFPVHVLLYMGVSFSGLLDTASVLLVPLVPLVCLITVF